MTPTARVLVLDADPAFTFAVQRVLKAADLDVVECNDPRDALVGIVRGEEYDAILCDMDVPHVSALDFHKQVAAMNPTLAARIVFLATEPAKLDLPNPQLMKPIGADELRAWVAEFVALRTLPPLRRSEIAR